MNASTPLTPAALLVAVAALVHLARGREPRRRLSVLLLLGVGLALSSLGFLRASSTVDLLVLPWGQASYFGPSPTFAADPTMLAYALALAFALAAAVALGYRQPLSLSEGLVVTGAAMVMLFARDSVSLALAWVAMQIGLVVSRSLGRGGSSHPGASPVWLQGAGTGLVLAAALVSGGAPLVVSGDNHWPPAALTLLALAVLVLVAPYPLPSWRVRPHHGRIEPADLLSLAPTVAGLALAQRVAGLGQMPLAHVIPWVGAGGALGAGLAALSAPSARHRAGWAQAAALGLVLAGWGRVDANLLFPAAAASLVLGTGLLMLQSPEPALQGKGRRPGWWILAYSPAMVLGLGPFSPSAVPICRTYSALVAEGNGVLLVLCLGAQMLLIASLTGRPAISEAMPVHLGVSSGVVTAMLVATVGLAAAPGLLPALAGDVAQRPALVATLLQSKIGVWAALFLPIVLGVALATSPGHPRWLFSPGGRSNRALTWDWAWSALRYAATGAERVLGFARELLEGPSYLAWAVLALAALALVMKR